MIDWIWFGAGVAILVIAGDRLVNSALRLSTVLGMSALGAGALIVGFGTSLPELVTSLDASFQGYPGAAIGNVVGSNIANLMLVLGLSVLWRPAEVERKNFLRDAAWLLGATAVVVALMQLEVLGRLSGLALTLGIAWYIYDSMRASRILPTEAEAGESDGEARVSPWVDGLIVAAGIAGLALGAHLLVTGAVGVAAQIGISESVMGIVLLALGTSLPELVVTVVALIRGSSDLAVGNVIGSTLFNLLGILGVAALVKPLPVPMEMAGLHVWVMAAAVVATIVFMYSGKRLSRSEGGLLLCAYPAYLYAAI